MKKTLWAIFILLLMAGAALALEEGRFFRYPTIHQDKIVFTYEGDLWSVGAQGGRASRLTSFPGTEYFAKFSPDGSWIAFSANYDGPLAVYVMPAEGGAPTRLTYQPGYAQTIAWSPDGSKVVFRSIFENFIGRDPNLYYVPVKGGAPERFPLDRGTLVSFSPDGRSFLYVRRGDEEYYWKRYKGGRYPDIWLYDSDTKKYTPVTDYVGKNAYPMWIGDTMYFVSDRGNGISNIYAQKIGTEEARSVTNYADFDVMMPNTDGRTIVYVHNGFLNLLDIPSGQSRQIAVLIPSDRWALRDRVINPRDYIHYAGVANDGKTVVLEARGDVFTVPAGKGQTENLSDTPGTREMYPALSPDGRWVAFFSDKTGDYQLYIQKVEGGDWTPLTTDLDRTVYHLLWSPDGRKILFGNKDFSIFYVDVGTKKLVKVDSSNQMKNDEFYWEISDYTWSPDSKWIAYSFVQFNRNSQIFIYNTDTGSRYAVTDDFYDNLYPQFDANGQYLYYVSSRNFRLQMDFYEDNHVIETPQQVMAVQLHAGEKPPFSEGAAGEKPEKKAEGQPFRIDLEGLSQRAYPVPVPAGNTFYLKAGKGKVLWASVDRFTESEYEEIFKPGGATKWSLHIFDIADRKDSVLNDKIAEFTVSTNGEQLLTRAGSEYHTTTIDKAFQTKGLGESLDLSTLVYHVNLQKEWHQIFDDCWRWYRDFFYSPIFNGHDWKALGEKYRAYIPYLSSREDLNWTMQQMVGELCVSHTYIGGGDYGPAGGPGSPVFTGSLAVDLAPDAATGLYKIETIYGPTDINRNLVGPLARPDIAVREGDYLLAINGTPLRAGDDYFKLLQVTRGQNVKVTLNSRASMEGAKTYDVEPVGFDQQLRYYRWVQNNIRKITEATNGRAGYMHINAMGSGGIGEFDKYWRAFRYKDGIIIDVRRNSGGWTEYFLIDKLERQVTAMNVLRNMVPFRYPGSAGVGNYVVISNENNGSDGEAFVEDFKARKLGTVVGVPSWGGLVGILNRQTTIDNGSVEQSNNSFYNREGKWLVENHGADPDILVDDDPGSVMAGRDLQLERAIAVILEKIKSNPFNFPPVPPYPIR
jgi:tricorn protease